MENPIKKFREDQDFSRKEFALILEVPYSTLSQVENINNTSYTSVIDKMHKHFDFNKEEFIEEYEQYLNDYREKLLRGIK